MKSVPAASCLSRNSRFHRVASLAIVLGSIILSPLSRATTDIAAVYAATANGYSRVQLPDGSYRPETYAFAEGGRWDGNVADDSLDAVPFVQVAHVIAGALRPRNYVMSTNPKTIDLMIMVFWGTTTGAENLRYRNAQRGLARAVRTFRTFYPPMGFAERAVQQGTEAAPFPDVDPEKTMALRSADSLTQMLMMNQAENAMRDRNNSTNAVILGYWDEYSKAQDLPTFAFSDSIIDELEANRYFVVLKAYDFQALRTQKQKRLLWETRFSVREQNNRFDEILPAMAQRASSYFGRNSGRLLREVVPVGRVEVGTPTPVSPER